MTATTSRRAQLPPLLAVRSVRLALAAAAATVAAAWAVAWAAHAYAESWQQEATRLRAERDAHRARLERDGGTTAIERFERLRARGLFGTGDAVAWVEALSAAVAQLGLPAPRFEVAARQGASDADDADAATYSTQQMRFRVEGLHEEEFLDLLARLAELAPGPFAVRECRLARAADDRGLTAECTLRWLVFSPPQRAASGDGGGRS
jgi:hypothetical protein